MGHRAPLFLGRANPRSVRALLLLAGLALLLSILIRTAWVSDDAYITFRTIDNFIHGYGLTWNTAERVQTYTHPLWMLLLSLFSFLTPDIYSISIVCSIVLSLAAAAVIAGGTARRTSSALIVLGAMISSRAFIDYSTSGLENPLSYLVLALFLLVYFRGSGDSSRLRTLSLLASAAILTRQDFAFIVLPPLIVASSRYPWKKGLARVLTGLMPVAAWELFSLFYYGFLVPNTAYTKLDTGIPLTALVRQGWYYLYESLMKDHVTLPAIVTGLVICFARPERRKIAVGLGISCYLLYLLCIGGDFMSGRLLTAPLICALSVIAWHLPPLRPRYAAAAASALLLISLTNPFPSLLSGRNYGLGRNVLNEMIHGVADERAFHYPLTGLLRRVHDKPWPRGMFAAMGRDVRRMQKRIVVVYPVVGMFGYEAGPAVYVIDTYALCDPLRARLPVPDKTNWRIGHFERPLPAGYEEAIKSGDPNALGDPAMRDYYRRLHLVIGGSLGDMRRLPEIWRFLSGENDRRLHASALRSNSDQIERRAPAL
jgi:arabinofuranosyltransferase